MLFNRQTNQYQTHLNHAPQQTLHHNPYATARYRRVARINISFQSHGMPFNSSNVHFMSGWLWVHFFFVLSGFIIFYVYGESFKESITTASYWKYIKARFARVYPLHFFTLIWCLDMRYRNYPLCEWTSSIFR